MERVAIIAPEDVWKEKFPTATSNEYNGFYGTTLYRVWSPKDINGRMFDSFDVIMQNWSETVFAENICKCIDAVRERILK